MKRLSRALSQGRFRKLVFEHFEDRRMLTLPALTIGLSSPVTEGDFMYATITLSQVSEQDVTVTVSIENGQSDWPFASTDITIPAGQTGYFGGWQSIDDVLVEPDEEFLFSLSNPINATLGTPSSQVVTIHDNDLPPEIDISVTALDEILANQQVDEGEASASRGRSSIQPRQHLPKCF